MIETRGIVTAVEGGFALIETERAVGCGQCQGRGCGTGVLSQFACSGSREIKALNDLGAQAGERVVIGIADGALLKGASVAYVLPLLLLLAGALLGSSYGAGRDIAAVLGALAGLGAGMALARIYNYRQRANTQFQPVVLQRL